MRTSFCSDHIPVQHRDGKPPWCRNCGMTAGGLKPESTLQAKPRPKQEPTEIARWLVVSEFNQNLNSSDLDKTIDFDDTYFYFFAYILGGWKCEISTTVPDNKIYEVTYNAEKQEVYMDVYVKINNRVIDLKENR